MQLALITSVLVFRLALPHEKQMAGMFFNAEGIYFFILSLSFSGLPSFSLVVSLVETIFYTYYRISMAQSHLKA